MFGEIAKLLLVSTAFAPVLLTLGFVRIVGGQFWPLGACYILAATLLTAVCLGLIKSASHQLEVMPFTIKSIKTADKEILSFVLAYLLPFASGNSQIKPEVLWFVLGLLFIVVWTTHSYHFSPVLGFFGFHFYEATTENSVTFILLTQRTIRDCSSIRQVVQLTDYIVLDKRNST